MAISRKNEFPEKELQMSNWCKALSHPARIAILKTLANRKECVCGELVLDLPLAQSTVSQHLKALKQAGLIQGEVDGLHSKYCIDKKNFSRFMKAINELSVNISNKIENLKCD